MRQQQALWNHKLRSATQIAGSYLTVNEDTVEGVAIANLIAADENNIVGWVYRWNTGTLAIRWDVHGPQRVSKLYPDLCDADKAEIDFLSLTQLNCRDD
jgi:hypothetical protein